jgi:hypothetical protein
VESLTEDFKLSTCGRQPLLFSLSFDLACLFLFLFFRSSVCYSSLGERSPMLHLTCAAHLVLYFWTHWRQCAILVWWWGRHFYLFICVKKNKNKNCAMLLIGHRLHHNCGLHVIGVFNLFEQCRNLNCLTCVLD